MSEYYDLGSHHRTVSTTSPEAQVWFDRGLIWTYAFNHGEAIKCFERVVEIDPQCAMAHWGIAYAVGPNYNKAWEAFDDADLSTSLARAYDASREAARLLDGCTPAEQALITALQARYQHAEPQELDVMDGWTDNYAHAMREVFRSHPDDLDAASLFAEALMNRTPWQLWNLPEGRSADGASTVEARDVLERVLERPESRVHPGVLHMYIHLMEMSPYPELALRASDWLRDLVPDAGHLQHMPTHIDVLCGHYYNVVAWNQEAIDADRKYVEREGALNFYSLYRAHNFHFKLYGALFLGQYQTALEAARELTAAIPQELLRQTEPPMADWLEAFVPMDMHVYIRFGKWQEIIEAPLPDEQDLYAVTTAVMHYARGVAYSATGRVADAERQVQLFEEAYNRVPETRYLFNNSALDILAVARQMLYGELEYRKGNYDVAYEHLRSSIELDDGLPYDEPWGWMQPTRHAYGALLLEQGHVEAAAAVYRADLGLDGTLARAFQHPENIWSLHGYHECLLRLGKHDEAGMIKQRLDLAQARSDTPIHASCFCRMSHAA